MNNFRVSLKYRIRIALYSLLDPIKLSLIGQLKCNEIFVAFTFPFLLYKNDFKRSRYFRNVILSILVLLFFQVFTDLIVIQNSPDNFLKGWSSTFISLFLFIFFFKTFKNDKIVAYYLLFSIIRAILSPADNRIDTEMSYFKFYITPILTNLILFLSYYLHKRNRSGLIIILFGVFGLFCLANDSRSNGVLFIVGAIIFYIYSKNIKLSKARVLIITVLGIIVFQFLYILYVNAILNKSLGGEHSSKQIEQLSNPYNPLELLLTGRAELFAASQAIKDNPFFGHGSWALDKNLKYTRILLERSDDDNEVNRVNSIEENMIIPSHSVISGAWVNYGLGGFIAVLFLFYYLTKVGFILINNACSKPLFPVLIIITLQLIWTFLFSPFQHLRHTIPQIGSILLSSYYFYSYSNND